VFGVYPGFAWTPDSKNLIFYARGKIRKLDVLTQAVTEVPFAATSQHVITDALHFNRPVFQEEFEVKMIRQLTTSPDGKMAAFNAAGYLYIKKLPDGTPERVTESTDFEFDPAFSPDGKQLVYVSWNDEDKGSVNLVELKNGRTSRLTTERGFYYTPRFSNKGDKVVYRKGSGNNILGFTYGKRPGIYIANAKGGVPVKISSSGIRPEFNSSDSRIYFEAEEGENKVFK